jgi:LCP family protein required for cell wall assembly
MRTTLKRGIGRGIQANGSGNGIVPPGAFTPKVVYRQPPPPPPSTLRRVGRFFAWLFVIVLMLVCAAVGGLYLWAKESVGATAPRTVAMKKAAKRLAVAQPGKPAVALIMGSDHRWTDHGLPARSDTIMLVRTDPETKTISLLSFPRDLYVTIHCPGQPTWNGKINAAYSQCGPEGTLETVQALTHVPVNYLINVNFRGFTQVVDKLGGVWMDVDRRYYNKNVGTLATDYANIDLQPGYQKLSGPQALAFVRYRHTDSDLVRNARQQEFLKAVKEQVSRTSPASLVWRIPKLVGAIVHNTEIGEAGGKGVDPGTVKNYAFFLIGLPGGHFFQPRIQGLAGYSDLTTAQSNVDQAVQQFLHPDVQAPEQASRALGFKIRKRKAAVRPVRPSRIWITVLNGNGRAGAARDGSYLLGLRGYRMLLPPNGQPADAPDGWNHPVTTVYYHPSRYRAKDAARQVAKLFGNARIAPVTPILEPLSPSATLVVVLGATFDGSLTTPPAAVRTQIVKQPAFVRTDPGATRSLLLGVRKRVRFRLELPTVLERNSAPTTQTPIRVYNVGGGHRAARLTFYRGAPGDYWGIEETDWNDAPVLDERNFTHWIHGRRFDLYYSGANLHMIVLREHGATYWVVNTLLDSLSNETMLAIAKGLRPLPR